jgi:hypothetical protein
MSEIKPKARQTNIVIQKMEEEVLIYDLKTDQAFALNSTSAMVWQLCDGHNSISEIADKMTVKLKEIVSEDLVWLALEKLKKQKLLEDDLATPFAGIARREVVRRVGTASLIALPLIGTLVAPSAANAQSTSCSTAIPPSSPPGTGGLQCRCSCSVPIGSSCGAGLVIDGCNSGCTCTRTNNCSSVTNPTNPIFNTALGSCG